MLNTWYFKIQKTPLTIKLETIFLRCPCVFFFFFFRTKQIFSHSKIKQCLTLHLPSFETSSCKNFPSSDSTVSCKVRSKFAESDMSSCCSTLIKTPSTGPNCVRLGIVFRANTPYPAMRILQFT